jgi:ATP-dependent helicase HrpA
VLATNVAETSLTVPGIRYVVDPGTARISRYSARLKVQRLPIEEVSQASADQRKGRSGRQSDGIAIRLYSEEDFTARPRFTDPEILRTNLASVILQMAALGLGEIEDFPFLDPPDRRQIRDGVLLLQELGALDPDAEDPARRLTPLGRRLAQLPVDPRFGRMVLEADRLGCVEEVVVIAAALSIQDPRERPTEQRAQADQLHGRFRDEHSDFIAFLNLWTYLQEQQRELSGSQFRKRLRGEFLHYLRVREWQDLVGQLRASARAIGLTLRHEPAEPGTADDVRSHVHIAMLAGLLSHVGVKDERRRGEYLGARGARFAIFPGSVLARRAPAWVMAAELVETTRLWGRTAARIEPAWVEPLAGHLVRRTYDEPHWERKRASAVALERVTLYGLPIVAGRKVAYGAIDPVLSRELFIRRGLVEGDWETRHHFFHDNRRLLAEVEALEDRVRRRDILVDDGTLFDFYDARIPAEIVSGAHFDRWWRKERRRDPERLSFTQELLVNADAADAVDPAAWPERWRDGELSLPLSYRFEPGTPEDGVTVHVPLPALAGLEAASFAWLVPGLRRELVTALVRALPKELRRPLVPVPEVVTQVLERIRPGEPLFDAVARSLRELRGVRVPEGAWDGIVLPPHLRTRFSIEDGNGDALAVGADLDALREAVRPRLRAELAAAAGPSLERSGLTAWTIGTLPREVELPGAGGLARAYPSLVDEGATVGVRMLDTPEAQAGGMHAGTRRLLRLTVPSPSRAAERGLSNAEKLTLAGAPHGSAAAALDDATTAALDALILAAGGPAWDEQGWSVLHDYVARELGGTVAKVVAWLVRILDAAREVQLALDRLPAEPAFQPARLDVARQLGRLTFPGFVAAAGVARLPDVERYLRGAARRIDQLPRGLAADRDRTRTIEELEAAHRFQLAAMPAGAALPAPLREVPWALEELRVSYFAQGLGVRGSASPKQVRKLLAEAARGAQPTG